MRRTWVVVMALAACVAPTAETKRWPDHRTLEEARIKKLEVETATQAATIDALTVRLAAIERQLAATKVEEPTPAR